MFSGYCDQWDWGVIEFNGDGYWIMVVGVGVKQIDVIVEILFDVDVGVDVLVEWQLCLGGDVIFCGYLLFLSLIIVQLLVVQWMVIVC